jgi:hypothetical protein
LFAKNDLFEGSAVTVARGVEYRITDYSYTKGIYVGLPIDVLTVTEPVAGVPSTPPVQEQPDLEKRVSALEKLVQTIIAFLQNTFSNFKKG